MEIFRLLQIHVIFSVSDWSYFTWIRQYFIIVLVDSEFNIFLQVNCLFYDFQKILIYLHFPFSIRLLIFHIYYFHSSCILYTNEVLKLYSIAKISVSVGIKFCNRLSSKGKPKTFQLLNIQVFL